MATVTNGIGASSGASNASASQSIASATKKGAIGKDEFLMMLVTQLKNQDPTNPMNSDQFAVNLAQFSQLEQLISINDKLGEAQGSDASSLAGFLGREVYTGGSEIDVINGNAGSVAFNVVGAALNANVQITTADGTVLAERELGTLTGGRHMIKLDQFTDVPDGSYKVKVNLTGLSGVTTNPDTAVGGIVTGFIPGPDATLLVGNREVKSSEVQFVGA